MCKIDFREFRILPYFISLIHQLYRSDQPASVTINWVWAIVLVVLIPTLCCLSKMVDRVRRKEEEEKQRKQRDEIVQGVVTA